MRKSALGASSSSVPSPMRVPLPSPTTGSTSSSPGPSAADDLARRVAEARRRVAEAQTKLAVKDNPYMVRYINNLTACRKDLNRRQSSSQSHRVAKRIDQLNLHSKGQVSRWPLILFYWIIPQPHRNQRRTDISLCSPNSLPSRRVHPFHLLVTGYSSLHRRMHGTLPLLLHCLCQCPL
jgi:hypothetical protein